MKKNTYKKKIMVQNSNNKKTKEKPYKQIKKKNE